MFNPVIAVDEANIIAFCVIEAEVACDGEAAVFGMEDADAGIAGGILVADLAAAVSGAVVDKKDLEVGIGLGQDAVQAFGQVGFCVVYGDDDGNHGDSKIKCKVQS